MPGRRLLILTLVLMVGLAGRLAAQDPVERSEFLPEPEDDPSELLLDFGLVNTSGNDDVTTVTVKDAYTYDPSGPWSFNQRASWLYTRQDGETNTNTITAGLRADRDITPRLALFATIGYFRAPFGGVSRRFDEGVGLAWKAIVAPRDSLDLEAGISFVQEHTTDDVDDNYTAARLAAHYKHMLTDRAYVGGRAVFLPNLSSLDDHLLETEVFLAAPLGQWLALRVSYLVRYDSSPPDDFETTDTVFTTGLQVQL
jgi:putative salt-induced outer membrane protein